jgi:CBS domain-containing protein
VFDRLVRDVMERNKALSLAPDCTVEQAAQQMQRRGTGAAMIVEHERLVGIFTERDALFRVLAAGLDPRTTTVASVMTGQIRTVSPGDTYGYALVLMQEGGFRHAPVVEDGRPVGIVSSRNAMDPDLEEFASEANRREHMRRGSGRG